MFEYDEKTKAAAKEIDEYDLSGCLDRCWRRGTRDPWDICEYIKDESIPFKMKLFEALDVLSTDEFMEYLEKRYNVHFEEIISYRMLPPKFMKG